MSESHGSNVSKGILNPSTGKFRPKAGPRQVRSKSSPERTRTPSPPPPKLDTISAVSGSGQASSSLLAPPVLSFTAPTPEASPISPKRRAHHKSTPTHPASVLRTPPPVQKSHSSGSTKRKADEAEVDSVTPPREREHKTTFAPEPRTHRASANSGSSHAPSSFHRSKRVRTSLPPPDPHGSQRSAAPSLGDSPNAKSTGSWSSKNSKASASHVGPYRSSRPPSTKDVHAAGSGAPRRSDSRRSLSQASIPISAFMSPHAPSISRSSTFHMRDPRKPSRIQATPWTLSFPDEVQDGASKWALKGWTDRGGSPLHAWLFLIGFIIFPLWWLAGFAIPIPRTRRLESGDAEKGVVLDDPQVEHDYKSWRRRCRIMAGVSILTYIPFIVLVAIFA
ncbi:hypothetical protein D9611_011042 [Ephemerocybe angulata]|uniref:Uncharacterized protein n=1 Tax=Ephemerocybe angulata TaxID=980116 RepID=A0A8H5F1D7_9AGAR|nr:hypothetical protein D9611_011042 [Tulosesus angulatus]